MISSPIAASSAPTVGWCTTCTWSRSRLNMKYLLTAIAMLALAASADAQQRFPARPGGSHYAPGGGRGGSTCAPGVVVLCISTGVAVPTTSGACDGGGQPVVVTGGLIQTTSCPP